MHPLMTFTSPKPMSAGNFSIGLVSVIASEAKQSPLLDCHVAGLLAMTANQSPEKCSEFIKRLRTLTC